MRDEDGFTAFAAANGRRLRHAARLLTGDDGRAEDLVQTALARTYLRWDRIRADDPWAYVRRCVVNGYTDWWRRRPWREQPYGDVSALGVGPSSPDVAARAADRDALSAALGQLTRRERAVVVLRYYADLSEVQIGAALGMTPGTVKSTSMRAMRKLRVSAHLQPEPSLRAQVS